MDGSIRGPQLPTKLKYSSNKTLFKKTGKNEKTAYVEKKTWNPHDETDLYKKGLNPLRTLSLRVACMGSRYWRWRQAPNIKNCGGGGRGRGRGRGGETGTEESVVSEDGGCTLYPALLAVNCK
jgi:hypothetical protein